mgnify:CR=1 FL=1
MSKSLEWSANHGGFVVGDFESDPVQDERDARKAYNAFMKAMRESERRAKAKNADKAKNAAIARNAAKGKSRK